MTQSLTKDMSSDVDLYRANAIRVLCRIIDVRVGHCDGGACEMVVVRRLIYGDLLFSCTTGFHAERH